MNGSLYVGIDAGSSATKCVVVDIESNLLCTGVTPSGFDYSAAAERVLAQALTQGGQSREDIVFCVSTGYGRGRVTFADRRVTEITCHARGAKEWYPDVEHIVDIGGQDTKVIRVDPHGKMADYRMNAKCAAGTGAFLESVALRLGMPLTEIDALAMQSTSATVVNSYCTVFAGTEVLERIKDGQPPADISMGLFRSIASRVFEMFSFCGGPVAATGGVVTYCQAMVRALEETLKQPVLRPPLPQHAGAYGGALLAREFALSRSASSHAM